MNIDLNLTARATGETFSTAAGFVITEPFVRAFEPIKTSDCDIGMIFGDTPPEAARIIYKLREDAAKEIAEGLTRVLMDQMKKMDTYNGYPIEVK